MQKLAFFYKEEEKGSDDSVFIRESFEKINKRLDIIESQITELNPQIGVRSCAAFTSQPGKAQVYRRSG